MTDFPSWTVTDFTPLTFCLFLTRRFSKEYPDVNYISFSLAKYRDKSRVVEVSEGRKWETGTISNSWCTGTFTRAYKCS